LLAGGKQGRVSREETNGNRDRWFELQGFKIFWNNVSIQTFEKWNKKVSLVLEDCTKGSNSKTPLSGAVS
jgi:hypothetical protein